MNRRRGSLAARIEEAEAAQAPHTQSSHKTTDPSNDAAATFTPPSRVGKKAVTTYVSPELSKALRMLSLENETTLQALVIEAFDDLLRKHGRSPIGG